MLPVLVGLLSAVAPLSESECAEMGYEQGLSCILCKELAEYGLKSLQSECNSCCAKSDEEVVQYKRAVLEVCSWKLGRFPHVSAFIDHKLKELPNMEVKYKKGAPPVVKLFGDSTKPEETVSIENWNEETLNQFIEEKLETPVHSLESV